VGRRRRIAAAERKTTTQSKRQQQDGKGKTHTRFPPGHSHNGGTFISDRGRFVELSVPIFSESVAERTLSMSSA
jgi:hypothetical protein